MKLRLLVIGLVLAAGAGYWWMRSGPDLPDPPRPDLGAVEPQVKKRIESVRAQLVDDPTRDNWLAYGRVLDVHDFRSEAAVAYDAAARLSEGRARFEPLYLKGKALFDVDRAASIRVLREAVAIRDDYGAAWVYLGRLLEESGEIYAAREAYEAARRIEEPLARANRPNNLGHVLTGLGRLALHERHPRRALDLLRAALAANPKQIEAQAALAKVYARLGRKAKAREASEAAGDLSRRTPMSDPISFRVTEAGVSYLKLETLAMGYYSAGDFKTALEYIDRALAVRPDSLSGRQKKANILARLHRFDDAIELYRKVLAEEPENADALQMMGSCMARNGDVSGARRVLDRALALDPENTNILFNLGVVLRGMDQREARRTVDRLLALAPDEVRARLLSAKLHIDAGDGNAAVRDLQHALRIDPKNTEARTLLEKLRRLAR